jgi:hypothetical protein
MGLEMNMKPIAQQLWPVALVFLFISPAFGSDMDDSVLVEQIDVSVKQYRRVMTDFEQLQQSLRAEVDENDVMASPKIQAFLQDSLNPADKEMRALFARYQREYGRRALTKLAKRRGYTSFLNP